MKRDRTNISTALALLNSGKSYTEVTSVTGLSYKTLRRYLALHNKYGEAFLSPGNRYYQTAEKVRAAINVLNGDSVPRVAAELGATEHSVRRWAKLYSEGGQSALKDKRLKR